MNNKIIVTDDVVSNEAASAIEKFLLSPNFPWFYNKGIDYPSSELGDYQFLHFFYGEQEWRSENRWLLTELLGFTGPKLLNSVKANLLPRTEILRKNQFHVDFDFGSHSDNRLLKTAIYYVNTCDGYTEFEDGTVVNSVKNRLVVFPTNLRHRGTSCTDRDIRAVINFNYISFTD